MNAAQLNGMRNLAATMYQVAETMTAREMALTSHKLTRDGLTARTTDGRTFGWAAGTEQWVRVR